MNGRDGKLDLPENGGKWNSYYYRTHANIDYLHRFKKVDLNIAGNFGLSNFNFLPDAAVRKQKFTSGDIHFGVKSTDTELPPPIQCGDELDALRTPIRSRHIG